MLALFELTMLAISIGLSLLAAKLLEKKLDKQAQDAPTTLATRGSFLPRVIGRRRVGAVFGWAGGRFKHKESVGKSGFLGKGVDIWREDGWHLLAVGPGTALHEIIQANKSIFKGPITPASHPSGTTVDLGREGTFRIFWGEVDQPVNSFIGDASRIGITSSWPHCFYIEWFHKKLGQAPLWQDLVYDIEVAPTESHLSNTPAYMDPSFTLDGDTNDVIEVTNGAEGTGKFTLQLDVASDYDNTGKVRSIGDTGISPDQDFTVLKVETRLESGQPRTDVFPVGGLTGAAGDGDLQAYTNGIDDGYNPAHVLAELWFSAWPHGIKQNKAEFDMTSLEDLGTLMVTEGIKGSFIAKDGQDLRSWMASIHQDLGTMLPHNFITGKLQFVPVRAPTVAVPTLTEDILVELPQTGVTHTERTSDRVLFNFTDRENHFRSMSIGLDDAGQASFQEYFRANTLAIVSTINFDSANVIAERRSQEELAGGADQKLVANRGARVLLPGTQIVSAGVAEVLLIMSVETDPLSGRVTLNCIPDFLGAAASSFIQQKGLLTPTAQAVEPDPQFQPFEIPEWISGPIQMVLIARLRAHGQIDGSALHISRDDATFTSKGSDDSIMQGGTLATAIAIDDPWEQDQGPTIDALGPDIGSVLDLSADTTSWRNGRQLVGIGNEIFYLKTITSLGGDQYRLDGLIRARYDTRPEAHSIGAEVYILQNDDGVPINDVLIEPQVTLYTKSQAVGRGLADLAVIPSESIALYGKGLRPVPVEEIRFDTLHPSVPDGVSTHSWTGSIGGDLPVTWGYYTPRSPGIGAGFAGAGLPDEGADPEGDFIVEILDSGDVLQRSITRETNDYIYTEANRVADFSGEPATFKIRITQLRSGQSSDTTVQTFTKV